LMKIKLMMNLNKQFMIVTYLNNIIHKFYKKLQTNSKFRTILIIAIIIKLIVVVIVIFNSTGIIDFENIKEVFHTNHDIMI